MLVSGDTLYGTASQGGTFGGGTIFAIKIDGTGFTNLYNFVAPVPYGTNFGGAFPHSKLNISGNNLYGTTVSGGSSGGGTVFTINTDGSGFTCLHSFSSLDPFGGGAGPAGDQMALSGETLYGTTSVGGAARGGIVFAINTDGTMFRNLHSLIGGTEGGAPWTSPIVSGNRLYGTANYGGSPGSTAGTVFSLSIQPQLTMIVSEATLVLEWPTNFIGFTLQSTTGLVQPIWKSVSPAPVISKGQNTVTLPLPDSQEFFRLIQ